MKSTELRYVWPLRSKVPVWNRYGSDAVGLDPVPRAVLWKVPAGVETCFTQNWRSRFVPPLCVSGTVNQQSPAPSDVQTAHVAFTGSVLVAVANSPSCTPAWG